MTYEQFYSEAMQVAISKGWRPGQALFNHLLGERPGIAEQLRGRPNDPFHCHSIEEPTFRAACEFIAANWQD